MKKTIALTIIITGIIVAVIFGVDSQKPKITSPGVEDSENTVTLPNGAIFNKTLAEYLINTFTQPKTEKINDNVTVMSGYSIENTVVIEGKEGIIVWDTGHDMATGEKKYNDIVKKITDKPIKAVIYSHNHYAEGTRAFVPQGKEGTEIEIIAHPSLDKNIKTTNLNLMESYTRNAGYHFGLLLPQSGPDSSVGNVLSGDSYSGYIPPTKTVEHGEILEIDGIKMQFFHTPSDTEDSITLWLPDNDTVITNSIWSSFPNMYTLRGEAYRNPIPWVEGIDIIRELNPTYLVLEHGNPITTRERSYELATNYRDAIDFIYNQAVRGINKGLRPDEIAESIELPKHLANEPYLVQTYGNIEHHIKGIYRGIIGWFDQDTATMNPVPIEFRSERIIEGFGGKSKLINVANSALENKEYAWAAELVTHILNIEPENKSAREIKAEALRQMAYKTSAYSERNYYLTQALELEGEVDINELFKQNEGIYSKEKIQQIPAGSFINLLESKINYKKSANIDKVLSIKFTDLNEEFGLAVRKGVAEYISSKPLQEDMSIELTRETWIGIAIGKVSIKDAIDNGAIKVNGDANEVINFMAAFDI